MGILQRFSDIMKSNINALLDKVEDPAKMVDQYLADARKDLAECKQETAGVMATEKAAERALSEAKAKVDEYASAARNAVKAGNDEDARALLARKQAEESQIAQLTKNYEAAHDSAEKMKALYNKLTADIRDLEARKATVKSTMAAAKAQEAVNRAGTRGNYGEEAGAAFSRMEQKANERLDKAMATADLDTQAHSDEDILKKYQGGGSASVDDELAALKAELGAQ